MHRNRLFWGGVLVILGLALLLNSVGIVSFNIWVLVWPSLIILFGTWILFQSLRKSDEISEDVVIPLEPVEAITVELNHGAGRINLSGGPLPGNLLTGSFAGGVVKEFHKNGDQGSLALRPPTDASRWFSFNFPNNGYDWKMNFNQDIQYQFKIKTGAGEHFFDFSNLTVNKIRMDTGASSTRMVLSAKSGFSEVDIHAGAASFEIEVPENIAARIRVQSGLADVKIDRNRFPISNNGYYQSVNYETSEKRADIHIEGGLASFSVK